MIEVLLPDSQVISGCAIHWEGLVNWGCVLLWLEPMGVLLVPMRGGGGH